MDPWRICMDRISNSAKSISEPLIPQQKIFTNALLKSHDITTLIRDTEPHERALFTVIQTPSQPKAINPSPSNGKQASSIFSKSVRNPYLNKIYPVIAGFKTSATVAEALGPELLQKFQDTGISHSEDSEDNSSLAYTDGINLEVLLEGAEKLCSVYPLPDVVKELPELRQRFEKLTGSIANLEERVAEQAIKLEKLEKCRNMNLTCSSENTMIITSADIQREEIAIKELERKKHLLEERISSLNDDLTGILG